MQPYFLPYIGYFQLMNAVDKFVIYDNIQFSKKGWVNRNKFLQNGKDVLFTIPLKKDSDYLNINQRYLSNDSLKKRKKILRQLETSYSKAPYFNSIFPILKNCFYTEEVNLFDFIYFSLMQVVELLEINTEFIYSSKVKINSKLKGQEKVLAICRELGCDVYLNPIGGVDLYKKEIFAENKIKLNFIKSKENNYKQFQNNFIPWLSIIDVMMFNSIVDIQNMLDKYTLK